MLAARLQLERYFVEECVFLLSSEVLESLEDDAEPQLRAEDVHVEVQLGLHQKDKNRLSCEMVIMQHDSDTATYPYEFRIALLGFFELPAKISAKERELMMTNSVPSLLYSAAREYLLLLTGRTRYYPLLLPAVRFAQPTEKPTKKRQIAAKSKVRRAK